MRIVRLRMVNYRRHRDTEIEFGDGVTAIVGRNGSGKTSILEAIAFALYGTHAVRTNKALVRYDAAAPGDAVRVELDTEVAGQALHIVRELRGVNQTGYASLTVDGQVIVPSQAGSSDAVTEEVAHRIGLDRETFFTTVFAEQKQLSRLADKSKAERKRLVLGMVGVDAIDRAIQEARTRRRESEARMQALQERIPDIDAITAEVARRQEALQDAVTAKQQAMAAWQAAQQSLQTATARRHDAEAADAARKQAEAAVESAALRMDHATRRRDDAHARLAAAQAADDEATRWRAQAERLPTARAALEAAIQAEAARRRLADLQEQVATVQREHDAIQVPTPPNGQLAAADAEIVKVRGEHDAAQQALATIVAQQRAIQDRRRRTAHLGDDADCPVCERPLQGHAGSLQRHLDAEAARHDAAHAEATARLSGIAGSLRDAEARIARLRSEEQAHAHAVRAKQQAAERLAAAEANLARAHADAPPSPGPIEPLRAAVADAEAAHAAFTKASAMAADRPALEAERVRAQEALDQATATHATAVEALERQPAMGSGLAEALAAHDAAVATERAAERNHAAKQNEVALAEVAAAHATRQAAEAREAQEALRAAKRDHRYWEVLGGTRGAGLLERFRNHLVGRIGPAISQEASRLLSRFTGGRYTEVILDDFEIYVTDGGVRYQLDRFSGGEADLVHLAIRLAVSRLLLERSGAEIRFLALDEVFGSLDEDRRGLVLDALQELGSLYSQVLLVTHHESLRDALDHTLLVEAADGESSLRHND